MSHTPGPWEVKGWGYNNGEIVKTVIQSKKDAVAEVWGLYRGDNDPGPEMEANAKLLAAAPALLAAARGIYGAVIVAGDNKAKIVLSANDPLVLAVSAAISEAE